MAEKISIRIDEASILNARVLLEGIRNGAEKAIASAVNKTMTGVKTDAGREIAKELNLSQARIKKDLYVSRMPNAALTARGRPVGLASFTGTRQTAKGVSVKVKKMRAVLKHAFLATTKGGAQNVFWRAFKGPRAKGPVGRASKWPFQRLVYAALPKKFRLPVDRLAGPRVPDILSNDDVMKNVQVLGAERLTKNLAHEVDRQLARQ